MLNLKEVDRAKIDIKITDVLGKVLSKQETKLNKTKVDLSQFSKGTYFVTIESNNKIIQSKKIIKN